MNHSETLESEKKMLDSNIKIKRESMTTKNTMTKVEVKMLKKEAMVKVECDRPRIMEVLKELDLCEHE